MQSCRVSSFSMKALVSALVPPPQQKLGDLYSQQPALSPWLSFLQNSLKPSTVAKGPWASQWFCPGLSSVAITITQICCTKWVVAGREAGGQKLPKSPCPRAHPLSSLHGTTCRGAAAQKGSALRGFVKIILTQKSQNKKGRVKKPGPMIIPKILTKSELDQN